MGPPRLPRPSELIDALDAKPRKTFTGTVWRVVREGRDALQGGRSGGRWDDGTFDVLYTALMAEGAVAEMYFHLLKGQPIMPSRVMYLLHEIEVSLSSVLDLSGLRDLMDLGLEEQRFGRLSYLERHQEYPTSQQIGEVAHFLEFDGILVPNARWDGANLIVFTERMKPDKLTDQGKTGPIEWLDWAKRQS